MDDIERLPWLEHERRHRAKHEPGLAARVIEAEPEWQLPQPVQGPDPLDIADPQGIGPIARLRRVSLGQCVLCARALTAEQLQAGLTECALCRWASPTG